MTDLQRFAHADHFVTGCDVSISDMAERRHLLPISRLVATSTRFPETKHCGVTDDL